MFFRDNYDLDCKIWAGASLWWPFSSLCPPGPRRPLTLVPWLSPSARRHRMVNLLAPAILLVGPSASTALEYIASHTAIIVLELVPIDVYFCFSPFWQVIISYVTDCLLTLQPNKCKFCPKFTRLLFSNLVYNFLYLLFCKCSAITLIIKDLQF